MEYTTKAGKATQTIPEDFHHGWLDSLDYRTAMAREMRERYVALTNDLGGVDRLSYAQRSLCERALWLEFWLASQERALAAGAEFDAGKWTQACNALQGIFSKLGLRRQTRDVPSLPEYLAAKGGRAA
jgi:hypothetical protein